MVFKNFFRHSKNRDKTPCPRKAKKALPTEQARCPSSKSMKAVAQEISSRDRNLAQTELFFKYYNEHAIDKVVRELVADTCPIFMKSEQTLTKEEFFGSVQDCIDSFPDLRFEVGRMEKQPDGSVICYDVMVIGTHSGKPFGFGPFEPIDVKNPPVKIQNDPEDVQLFFDANNKMCKYVFLTMGDLSGPPGLYTQLGGFPIM